MTYYQTIKIATMYGSDKNISWVIKRRSERLMLCSILDVDVIFDSLCVIFA